MELNFAKRQARRIFRNKLILLLVALAAMYALFLRTMPNPQSLYGADAESFATAEEAEALYRAHTYYVTTTAEEFFDTDYYITEDRVTVSRYYAFNAGDRFIVCRVDPSFRGDLIEDYLVIGRLRAPTDTESEILTEIAGEIYESWNGISRAEANTYVSPYILAVGEENRLGNQILFPILVLVALALLAEVVFAAAAMGDYTKSKPFKRLTLGTDEDPERVNDELSRELSQLETDGGVGARVKPPK
ncbi:MAG: hypothetical protein LBT36_00090, partial [Oscillospiraceae bacterium]|nr:hypothetical protein [Oscillospiraceae bacterium]